MLMPTCSVCLLLLVIGLVSSSAPLPSSDDCFSTWNSGKSCQDYELVPLSNSIYCQWYCRCMNNVFYPRRCLLNKYYDPYNKTCIYDNSICSSPLTSHIPILPSSTTITSSSNTPSSSSPTIPVSSSTNTPSSTSPAIPISSSTTTLSPTPTPSKTPSSSPISSSTYTPSSSSPTIPVSSSTNTPSSNSPAIPISSSTTTLLPPSTPSKTLSSSSTNTPTSSSPTIPVSSSTNTPSSSSAPSLICQWPNSLPSSDDCNTNWNRRNEDCKDYELVPMANPNCCNWYCRCMDQKFYPRKCFLNRYYDPYIKACTYGKTFCNAPTSSPSPAPSIFTSLIPISSSINTPSISTVSIPHTFTTVTAPTSSSSNTTSTSSITSNPTIKPEKRCAKSEEGKMIPGSDCKHYLKCIKGNWQSESCGIGYYFYDKDLECKVNWMSIYC